MKPVDVSGSPASGFSFGSGTPGSGASGATAPAGGWLDESTDKPVLRAPASPFLALCGLMMRTQVTRVRLLSLGGLGLMAVLVGWAYGAGPARGQLAEITGFVNDYGISLLVPVASLVFASSMFGDPADDKTLVYLWLRPIPRRQITGAAALVSALLTWPLAVPALAVTAAAAGGGRDLVLATVIAATVGVLAYTGVFLALGVRVRWPLVWGLLYILIWEGFVARGGLAKFVALRAYSSSILDHFTDAKLDLGGIDSIGLLPAIAIPLAVGLLALLYATRRLSNQDVA